MSKPIKNHISSGGVLFDKTKKNIFLIYKRVRKEWLLPKGHAEKGETLLDTAIRETQEETGYQDIKALSEKPLGSIEYSFEQADDPKFYHHKKVTFFALQLESKRKERATQEEGEDLGGKWFLIDNALKKITHEDERIILKRAMINKTYE